MTEIIDEGQDVVVSDVGNQDTLTDETEQDTIELGEVEYIEKKLNISSLEFAPTDGELTYSQDKATYVGSFSYVNEGESETRTATGKIVFNIEAGNGLEILADNSDTNLVIKLDSETISAIEQISTLAGDIQTINSELDNKVDKVSGKGLSTNDYTNEEKVKVSTAVQPADLLPYSVISETGNKIVLELDSTNYKITAKLKDKNDNVISTSLAIDLPLESVVVNGTYDSVNKKIILTLQNGNTVDIPVGDLVAGLQSEITSSNKLDADLVDDTNATHKFVLATDKTAWNAKYNKPSTGIPAADLEESYYLANNPSGYTKVESSSTNGKIKVDGTDVTVYTLPNDVARTSDLPTKVSDLQNDSGFITGYTETDPTVPAWAKASSKPTYSYSEITNTPSIPTKTSDLTNDSGFITGYTETDPTVPSWAKQSTKPSYDYSEITNTPTIPTVNNPTITITQGGVTKGSFTLNQATGDTIALDAGGGGGGSATDVQVDNVSQVVNGVANLKTKNGNYNASTNKLVTESDLPTVPTKTSDLTNDGDGTSDFARLSDLPNPITITTTSGSESVSDGTNTLNFGSNAFNSTPIPTTYVSSVNGSSGAITNVAKTDANNTFSGTNNFTGTFQIGGTDMTDFIVESGTDYFRTDKGIQVCWGIQTATGGTKWETINLPKAFLNTNYSIILTTASSYTSGSGSSHAYVSDIGGTINKDTISATSFQYYTQTSGFTKHWVARGLWK